MMLQSTASASLRWLLVLSFSFLLLIPQHATAERDPLLPSPDFVFRKVFDGPVSPFYFFDDSEVVMVFDHKQQAWRSDNAGADWNKVDDIDGRAIAMQRHPTDNNVAVVLGTRRVHWYTRDKGETWTSFKTPEHPARGNPVSFHSGDSKKIIINLGLGAKHEAVYTVDGFKKKPSPLRKDSVQCMWAKERPQMETADDEADADRILCIIEGTGYRPSQAQRRLIHSDDYFETEVEPTVEGGRTKRGFVSMVSATKFIYAARKADDSQEMALHVTSDGRSWHRALFGKQKLEADGFTVMEGTNYSARVDVMDGGGMNRLAPMGSLFYSNSNGTFFTPMEGYTNRNEFGFVDFESIDGIQGVALANIIDNPDDVRDGSMKRIKSQITWNDGRSWSDLKGTKWDKKGTPLHLHSYSEMRNQGKVYSNKGAPGLVMGVGNVGESLVTYDRGDLWVSTDGGKTFPGWLAGAHKYEFGDSGAMLCAVYDIEKTDQVMWSTNSGEHWEGFKLISDNEEFFHAGLLTTVPDSTSTKFLLQATTTDKGKPKHWIYSIDLSYWHEKKGLSKCKDSDFEDWEARQSDDDDSCIMGHTQTFRRRKPDVDCYVGKEFDEPIAKTKDCECKEVDFECDSDYQRSEDRKSCIPYFLDKPRGVCESDDGKFKSPSGFRKIPGNTCKDNDISKKLLADVERSCKDATGKQPAGNGDITSTQHDWNVMHFKDYRYLERSSASVDEDKDEVLVAVTETRELWMTRNHGKEWDVVKELEDVEVLAIVTNPYEKQHAYFLTAGKEIWYTRDRGETFSSFKTEVPPTDPRAGPILQFHPKEKNWLIFAGCGSRSRSTELCKTTTYRTTKHGATWEPLIEGAGSCEFVWQEKRNVSEKLIYCSEEKDNGQSLSSSDDWFEKSTTLFDDIVSYATMDEFIVVATRDASDPENLMLNSSIDATSFAPARFPPKMKVNHGAYTVLDSSTNSIFAHATVNSRPEQEYGNIIKSNSNGTNFVNSLDNVNRNRAGFVDFEKIQGIQGAALANVVENAKEVDEGKRKQKKTRMTHNDGADWAALKPPTDINGEPATCDTRRPACGLQLHSYTERRKPDESYSSPSAIGLIMGVGNVDEYLGEYGDGDTYISRDGGVSWGTAAKGQFLWEFGDQGSLIVLAPDKTPTDTIKYSTDEGKTFNDYKFTKGDLEVVISDLTTIPSDGSMMFILWAHHSGSRNKKAVTFTIDFSGIFERKCELLKDDPEKSDYYLWSPKHPMSDGDCLFGHVAQYYRKKESSEKCYNGPNLERFHAIKEDCECTARDFECDYNFVRSPAGTCEQAGELPDPVEQCAANPDQVEYYDTIGYRRIPGDTCVNGRQFDKVGSPKPCPKHEKEFEEKHGTSGWVIALAVLLSVGGAAAIGYFFWTRYGAQFGRIQLGDSLSGRTPAFDTDAPWVRYPVMAVSGLAAAAMAVPMLVGSGARWIAEKLGRSRRSGWAPSYTSRRSFARGRGTYAAVGNEDESDLLGEESDEDA